MSRYYASDRAHKLTSAVMDMTARYARSAHCSGIAYANGRGETGGKTLEQWDRATNRQYRALIRLTYALRDVDVTR